MRGAKVLLAAEGLVLALSTAAHGLINPNFTPVALMENADLILVLSVAPPDQKDLLLAKIARCLKGQSPGKDQVIDLGNAANKAITESAKGLIGREGNALALFFVGKGEDNEPLALVHVGGQWLRLNKAKAENTWALDSIDGHMEATWAGGTDMLEKLCELLVKFPDTDVPVVDGAKWVEPVSLGKVAGKVGLVQAVDIGGQGENALFIASDAGDRLFQWDRKAGKFEDLTAKVKLGSKSVVSAWGDFNGDGRLDLASWDGKALTVWLQSEDGTFSPTAASGAPEGECLGLVAAEAGVPGRVGLLWTTAAAAPVLLVPDKEKAGTFVRKPLAAGAASFKDLGAVSKSLIADFDGDNLPDVIQVFANGSLFFKGKGPGEFAEAAVCPIGAGGGRTTAFVGDWDMDGRLDVFTACEKGKELWQNAGGGKFERTIRVSGEAAYIPQPRGIGGGVCDFNNDGRQDFFLYYSSGAGPQLFFNRGFRSFGHGHTVDLGDNNLLPGVKEGQQAAAVADFTGDAAQDLVVVMVNGDVFFFQNDLGPDDSALAVRVALAPGGASAGPVTVTAANDRRSLGAWAVSPGTGEALLSRRDAGEVTLTWTVPGGTPQRKTVTLESKAVRMVLPVGKDQDRPHQK